MIEMQNVTKIYDNNVKALNDVTLHIPRGDFVFLVGPSGAGKSTLAKLIFREELPTRGKVLFNRKDIARYKGKEIPLMRRNIGMVFQDFRLLPKKNVFENVAFALQIAGMRKRDIKKAVPPVLKMVGLQDRSEMMPSQLSGGEKQRVCIARAIVNRPPLIIADEPTGNLDPETSREIMDLLVDINRRGTTVLVATHAREIVDSMRRRVVALSGGKVIRDQEKGAYEC